MKVGGAWQQRLLYEETSILSPQVLQHTNKGEQARN